MSSKAKLEEYYNNHIKNCEYSKPCEKEKLITLEEYKELRKEGKTNYVYKILDNLYLSNKSV